MILNTLHHTIPIHHKYTYNRLSSGRVYIQYLRRRRCVNWCPLHPNIIFLLLPVLLLLIVQGIYYWVRHSQYSLGQSLHPINPDCFLITEAVQDDKESTISVGLQSSTSRCRSWVARCTGCTNDNHLLWRCQWCSQYWSEMLDQRLLEEHLLTRCVGIPPSERLSYRLLVLESIIRHHYQAF